MSLFHSMWHKRIAAAALVAIGAAVAYVPVKMGFARGDADDLSIVYPFDGSLFPPEVISPTMWWEDANPHADRWRVTVAFDEGESLVAEVDTTAWTPDRDTWETMKRRSLETEARVSVESQNLVLGVRQSLAVKSVSFATSRDSVGAPIFYRDVPLPFRFALRNVWLIRWRLGDISSYEPAPTVLTNLPVCGNCHTFSADGKTLGMDVDIGNDKGAYVLTSFDEETILSREKLISWSSFVRDERMPTFGMLPNVSPDGRHVLAGVKDRTVFLPREDIYFSQIFFPVMGILAYYDRLTGRISALRGADNDQYVQSNGVWTPDGRYVVFARNRAVRLTTENDQKDIILNLEESAEVLGGEEFLFTAQEEGKEFKFDLYRVPFNQGRGGTPEPIRGASGNDMSNFFPKVSPDGRWLVFTQAHSFMLLQPDSKLYIMPAEGGEPRLMRANTNRMNSWHSWSPNGKWLVFSSKVFSPYTQLFLTHIDEEGNDTPPVLLRNFTSVDRAANIPEFVNIDPASSRVIREMFIDDYNYFRSGRIYQDFREYDKAEEDYQRSLEMNPENTRAYYFLGTIHAERENYDEALTAFQRVAELDPRNADVHENLGSVYFAMEEYDKAGEEFETAVALDPTNVEALFNLGTVQLIKGEPARAEAQFRRLLQLEIDDSTATRVHMNLGGIYFTGRDYWRAVREYLATLALDSAHTEARFNLGIAYRAQNALPEARRQFEKLLELEPDNIEVRNELGRVCAQTGDFQAAVREFERVLESSRRNVFALAFLGRLYYELRRFEEAEVVLTDLLGVEPRNVNALVELGRVYGETRRYDRAVAEFKAALEAQPNDSRIYVLLGDALAREGRSISEAIAAYERGIALDPRNVEAYISLGQAHLRAESPQDALRVFQAALSLNPTNTDREYLEAQIADLGRRVGNP